jgi:signal transduction histidine kinase
VSQTPNEPPTQDAQLQALLAAMEAANQGDFSHRLPVHGSHPLMDRLAQAFNTGATLATTLAAEVDRVSREVATEGKLGGQAAVQGLAGGWKDIAAGVNLLASSFAAQVRDMTQMAIAVAKGDTTQRLSQDVRGEALVLKNIINTMVDRLAGFSTEVNRVARELGPEGKRGGLASLPDLAGIWRELADNVNVTEQLALASRYKSEFLANMSHELRTPLNSLLILAKVLAENPESRLSSREVEYAKTIYASGTDLLSLINEILDLSKVEAGKMRVEPCEVRLTEVREFIERSFRHVAEQRGLGFSVSLAPGLPASLYTDPQRLQQVLKNLLSNALKFTHSGRVELRIAPVNGQLAFSVVDTGIGIAQDKQALIFEAFQQADGTTSRKYGGTGLGLSISLAMTHLLGGELHVASQPGQGSTFTLSLPQRYTQPAEAPAAIEDFAPLPPPRKPEPEPAVPSASLVGCKVLIVDDDIRNIFALTSVLESWGLEVLYAENGVAGLEALNAHPAVDVVFMDVMMPGMDGYECMRAIRKEARFAALPIIAITAKALKEDHDKCLAAGASDYLFKPVELEELRGLLHRWCC